MSKTYKAFNGYGGFNNAGDEYEILNTHTPLPWCNVLTNERFGTLISTYGTVYSFYKNAGEFKLTHWCNDWAEFVPGEHFKGVFDNDYNLTYGFGYVKVNSEFGNIERNMDIFVPINDDVKIHYIMLKNNRPIDKEVVIEYKLDMVMGVAKEVSSDYVLCKHENDMLYFKNPYNEFFSNVISYTKAHFLNNSEGTIEYDLEAKTVRIKCMVKKDETATIAILFGATDQNVETIQSVINKYSKADIILNEYDSTKKYWREKVVRNFNTGNEYVDIMANGWLMYQAIASRLFARTGLYQAGGAFGYRDQLQDSLALISSWPERTRAQIIKHAAKQFEQGDVLHWWHEHNSRGIRTHFSDDYLWLPYVLSEYILKTGDESILKEKTPFLEDKPLGDRDELYDYFAPTENTASIYDHALIAIKYGLSRKGRHGLLSIGDGDWNDGFSNIKGESVWLTFFMMDILDRFIRIADLQMDEVNKMRFMSERHVLKHAIFASAWTGDYFARAFFPDGTPLGTPDSEQCKIDLISQAWATIALKDYPDTKEEIKSSLESAEKYLVDRKHDVIKLLSPPFDNPKYNPGYIKAYVPGVRENGGQYTHGAIWLAKAYFEIGEPEKALDILKILNPINHSDSKEKADIYMVEPYVVAADVYSNENHVGRGGWTWYTGSAAWMYKVIEDNFIQGQSKKRTIRKTATTKKNKETNTAKAKVKKQE